VQYLPRLLVAGEVVHMAVLVLAASKRSVCLAIGKEAKGPVVRVIKLFAAKEGAEPWRPACATILFYPPRSKWRSRSERSSTLFTSMESVLMVASGRPATPSADRSNCLAAFRIGWNLAWAGRPLFFVLAAVETRSPCLSLGFAAILNCAALFQSKGFRRNRWKVR